MTRVVVYVERREGEPAFLAIRGGAKAVHLGEWWSLPAADVVDSDRAAALAIGAEPARWAALRVLFGVGGPLLSRGAVPSSLDLALVRRFALDDPGAFAERISAAGLSLDVARTRTIARVSHHGDVLSGVEAVVGVDAPTFVSEEPTATFVARSEALGGWATGTFLPAPSLATVLRAIRHDTLAFGSFEASSWEVAPAVSMMAVRTPTLPPATHTNAFLVGNGECVLVEPASPYPEEIDRLVAWVRDAESCGVTLRAILVTHHHPDHVGGAMALKARLGVPLWGHARTADRLKGVADFDRLLEDDERIRLAGSDPVELRVIHTPGHAPGHLCFLEERSGAMIAGDMVAGIGTILVETHDGDMQLYLESLRRMRGIGAHMLLPAHGGVVRDPGALLDFYLHHRAMREAKVKLALEAIVGGAALHELVKLAYDDTPSFLWPLAERSLEAHLVKLEREGFAYTDGSRWEKRA